LVFCGFKFLKKSLAVVGFLGGAIITAYIATLFTNFMTWDTKGWVIFSVVALVVGIIIAAICYNSPTAAIVAGGAALGYFGATQLFVLYASLTKNNLADVYQGAVFAVCIGVGIVLGWKLKKAVIILATSLTGSYMFAFGLGSLLKNFPDVSLLKNQFKTKDYKNIDQWAWIYLGGTLVLFLIGSIYQFSKYGKKEDQEDGYNKDQGGFNQQSDDFTGYY
jgi:MFS family permease